MNLFHIDNQPDPNAETSPIVFGQAEQNRLQRENDRAREAALAQRAAVLAEINHCSIEEVQEVLRQKTAQPDRSSTKESTG